MCVEYMTLNELILDRACAVQRLGRQQQHNVVMYNKTIQLLSGVIALCNYKALYH